MKTHIHLFSILFTLLFYFNTQAQTVPMWEPIGLTVTGNNQIEGIEAWYSLSKCKGQAMVYLKFVNTTNSSATIEWFDGIFTTELKWVKKEKAEDKKTLIIPANSEVKADCTNATQIKNCTIFLNKILTPTQNVKRYGALNF
ncbi:MAG: hypothetical protein ABL940_05000, partial [Bacteroidia bacterium]